MAELRRLKYLPKIISKTEKWLLSLFSIAFIVSIIVLLSSFYYQNTVVVPATGGILREGIVGQPRFINPVYASSNDPDRDLVNLIFSGLFQYNDSGEIVPDIVQEFFIEENGRVYHLFLKETVVFHDGEPLTAEDVIFTIRTIQNPNFKSPIRARWLEVEAKKISEHHITLTLKDPYPAFLETLTLKILPSHIWQDISAENFPLSPYNFQPIGSGPFRFKDISQSPAGRITAITLEKFPDYHNQLPYIEKVSMLFFENKEALLRAARNNIVNSFVPPKPLTPLSKEHHEIVYNFNSYSFTIPRYFALFFNSRKNEFLKNEKIRLGIHHITNREDIKKRVLGSQGTLISSPFLPNIYQFADPTFSVAYDPEKGAELFKQAGLVKKGQWFVRVEEAETMNFTDTLSYGSRGWIVRHLQECLAGIENIYPEREITGFFGSKTKAAVIRFQEKYYNEILRPAGLRRGNGRVGPSTRKKLNQVCIISPSKTIPLEITITTPEDPMLKKTAEILKEQWATAGIQSRVESLPISEIKKETIKERQYQALLFGQVLGILPDPFPFWHSTQRSHPGLNLANYRNKKVDRLLEQAMIEQDIKARNQKFETAQEYLLRDVPAIFLYNPNFIYLVSNQVRGITPGLIADPSQRFAGIQNWHIGTKRIWE